MGIDMTFELVVTRLLRSVDTVIVELERSDGEPIPYVWQAGAHIDVVIDSAAGLVRQYSLCGDPSDGRRWRIAVRRAAESRGGSVWLHEQLEVGSIIRASAPRNRFPLEEASDYVFIAGGIGITPILPMLVEAESRGAEWSLIYAGRAVASMPFSAELLAVHPERVRLFPSATSGRVDLAKELSSPRDGTLVYACGPDSLLDEVAEHCASWDPGSFRFERFIAAPVDEAAGSNHPFSAELVLSGMTVDVAADQTLLEAVESAGVLTLSSCREGTCGTCEIVVRAGVVDHRDAVLTPDEREVGETMMICVSRARTESLVLEL